MELNLPLWLYYVIGFPLLLGPLVTIHELGHYLVGRWFGVHAEAFSVGFGKEIWGFTDRRGTRWKLSVLPLEALIAPGDAAEFRCDLKTDHELGPFDVPLAVTLRGQMAFAPAPEVVSFKAVVADPVLEIHDGEGKPMAKAELGRVYCGLARTSRATDTHRACRSDARRLE